METTSNIPATGWSVRANYATDERRQVQFNMEAEFTLSHFAVRQLLFGEIMLNGMENNTNNSLFKKLAVYGLDAALCPTKENLPIIGLERAEVKQLRRWLEARMAHCEEERDSESGAEKHSHANSIDEPSKKFNPDTYIAQKFLLLDIREWLAGDIID